MPATYEPIATFTASGSDVYATFSSIPQTYTDLILVIVATRPGGSDGMDCQVGSGSIDTGNNYSFTALRGNGSTAGSYRVNNYYSLELGTVNAAETQFYVYINDYSNTTTFKTHISRGSNSSNFTEMRAGCWRNTAAINTLRVFNGSYVAHGAGSTFTLYGIKAA